MEPVRLRLGSGRRRWSDPFGFSWPLVVSLRRPRLRGLDFLGFPWILSSESRLFNGLRGLKRGQVYRVLFPGVSSAGTGACGRGHAEAQACSWGKLNLVSDFRQWFVVRAVSFRPPSIQNRLAPGGPGRGGPPSRGASARKHAFSEAKDRCSGPVLGRAPASLLLAFVPECDVDHSGRCGMALTEH